MADNPIYGGLFNFQDIMKDFYSDQNKSDDQRIMKSAFQGNFIQSGLNMQLSSAMAEKQAALSKDQMKVAADLELRNTSSIMEQQFKYGSQAMSRQYELQNEFADNQNKRDVAYLGAKGEDTRKTVESTGLQDRLSKVTQGEQDRLNTQTKAQEQRVTDTNKIGTEGIEERKTVAATGEEKRKEISTTAQEKRQTVVTEGEQQRATDTNKATVEGSEQRKTDTNRITTEGEQERETLTKKDDLDAKKENRASARSRSLARAF